MTAEVKAKALIHKVYSCPALQDDITFIQAQVIAIMMVEEIQNSDAEISGYDPSKYTSKYWEEVKEQILKI